MKTRIDLRLIQTLARLHCDDDKSRKDSARSCLASSIALGDKEDCELNDYQTAAVAGLRSLSHSVGICHPAYKRAFKASGISGEVRLVSIYS